MASGSSNATQKFLEASARHYAIIAPAISAHLMLQQNMEGGDFQRKRLNKSTSCVCKACGTIQIPGWTSKTRIEKGSLDEKKRSGQRAVEKSAAEKEKSLVVECLACHRYIKARLDSSRRPKEDVHGEKASVSTNVTAKAITKPALAGHIHKPAAVKSGSRQRAKARKGGLRAMLEQSKESSTPALGSGLGLLDLMKQG